MQENFLLASRAVTLDILREKSTRNLSIHFLVYLSIESILEISESEARIYAFDIQLAGLHVIHICRTTNFQVSNDDDDVE